MMPSMASSIVHSMIKMMKPDMTLKELEKRLSCLHIVIKTFKKKTPSTMNASTNAMHQTS